MPFNLETLNLGAIETQGTGKMGRALLIWHVLHLVQNSGDDSFRGIGNAGGPNAWKTIEGVNAKS